MTYKAKEKLLQRCTHVRAVPGKLLCPCGASKSVMWKTSQGLEEFVAGRAAWQDTVDLWDGIYDWLKEHKSHEALARN